MAKQFVRPPLLAKLNSCPFKISVMLFEFPFKPSKKRKSVSRSSCESGENRIVVKSTHLPGCGLHDCFTHRDLAITCQSHSAVSSHQQNCGAADVFFWLHC